MSLNINYPNFGKHLSRSPDRSHFFTEIALFQAELRKARPPTPCPSHANFPEWTIKRFQIPDSRFPNLQSLLPIAYQFFAWSLHNIVLQLITLANIDVLISHDFKAHPFIKVDGGVVA